jgi:hypothetical protein
LKYGLKCWKGKRQWKNEKKEKKELAPKTPETGNPFGMMRRFTKDMERLFNDFEEFRFSNFFKDFAPSFEPLAANSWCAVS